MNVRVANRSRRILLTAFALFCVIAAAFSAGGILEPFRSKLFKKAYAAFFISAERPTSAGDENTKDSTTANKTSAFDTALLPLKRQTITLSSMPGITLLAGAICNVGDKIVIIDRLGKPFIFDLKSNSTATLPWPKLPTNYDDFLSSKTKRKETNFRVHGLTCFGEGSTTHVVVAHEFFQPETDTTHMVVSELLLDPELGPMSQNWRQVFVSKPLPGTIYAANGAGGRLIQDGQSGVYLTIGDYNVDNVFQPGQIAQDDGNDFGGVFRIDLKTGEAKRLTKGQRNPQGIVQLSSGDIMTVEHGPKGGDELNRVVEGGNYGWPLVTYGTDYTRYDWPGQTNVGRHDGFSKPVFSWVPSIAPTNVIQLEHISDRWKGDLLVGSLKASSLYRIRYEENAVRYVEPIWIGSRIRDLLETPQGEILLWTDAGEIIRLSVDTETLKKNAREESAVQQPGSLSCMNCHHVGTTNQSHTAPSLSRILNRKIASDDFANYSEAMKGVDGNWTEERLRLFLLNPEKLVPGTSMPQQDLSLGQIDKAITYLRTLD
jgi:cytochrome c2